MVEWCTQNSRVYTERGTSHATNTERYQWILIIRAIKGYSHSFRIACDMCALSLLESREQRYIKAMNNNSIEHSVRLLRSEYTIVNRPPCTVAGHAEPCWCLGMDMLMMVYTLTFTLLFTFLKIRVFGREGWSLPLHRGILLRCITNLMPDELIISIAMKERIFNTFRTCHRRCRLLFLN